MAIGHRLHRETRIFGERHVLELCFGLDRGEPGVNGIRTLAEGVFTAPVLLEMARDRAIDMPISAAVADLLSGKMNVDAAIESLLTRPFKAEA